MRRIFRGGTNDGAAAFEVFCDDDDGSTLPSTGVVVVVEHETFAAVATVKEAVVTCGSGSFVRTTGDGARML